MGKRNMRVRNVKRSANGAVGLKSEACEALDGNLERIGEGLMRTVYVNKTYTIVYKVPDGRLNRTGPEWNYANETEFEAMVDLRNDPETAKYHTPLTLMYVDGIAIIAMVYRPGESYDAPEHLRSRFEAMVSERGIRDMHEANWRTTPNGRCKITDIGDFEW